MLFFSLDLNVFDSLSWDYLLFVLQRFGCGPNFLATLKALCSWAPVQVLLKGYKISNAQRCMTGLSSLPNIICVHTAALNLNDYTKVQALKYYWKKQILIT